MDIAFNIDENYITQCKTVIKSILAHTKEPCTFHIIGANIKGHKCYKKPDLTEYQGIKPVGHISISAGYRLFLPDILDVDKVIYLDCDLIVLDDLKKLWDYDVKLIAGVQDPLSETHKKRNNLKGFYVNSGVLLMNLKELRKIDYKSRLKAIQTGYDLSLPDQDIINIAYGENIQLLPEKWNVYSKLYAETTKEMLEARNKPSIIHWCGNQKPWNADIWKKEEFLKYMSKERSKKAIVLTYPNITDEEKKLLQNTDVFKIACNWHAEELKPDIRLIADGKETAEKTLKAGKQDVVSLLYLDENEPRLLDYKWLPNRNSTLPSCVDYLIEKGFTDILLVANNKVTNSKAISKGFQETNRKAIKEQSKAVHIYKYSLEGVFDVPTVSIKEFLEMNENSEYMPITEEDKLLGRTTPRKKTLLELFAFSDSYQYEVHTEGLNNHSIESGETIKNILTVEAKREILEGAEEINYKGLIIKRLTGIKPKEEEKDVTKMSYNEMLKYCKENNIKAKSNKKEDLIEAIKGE